MLRDITLGQYYPVDSVLHRMDPRTKLAGTLVFLVSLFVSENLYKINGSKGTLYYDSRKKRIEKLENDGETSSTLTTFTYDAENNLKSMEVSVPEMQPRLPRPAPCPGAPFTNVSSSASN